MHTVGVYDIGYLEERFGAYHVTLFGMHYVYLQDKLLCKI